MPSQIGVLDYGMGNLRSVCNAICEVGRDYALIRRAEEFDDAGHLIIPGVGNFRTAMKALRQKDLMRPILAVAASGRPVLGVCLGMQVLAERGTEGGDEQGLGLIRGVVQRLKSAEALRIPHIGWNTVTFRRDHPVLAGVKDGRDFYFVHSYAFDCDDTGNVLGTTDYGTEFAAIVVRENVVGFQFHPEKSQINGLQLLENFCDWDGAC